MIDQTLQHLIGLEEYNIAHGCQLLFLVLPDQYPEKRGIYERPKPAWDLILI